MTLKWKPNTPKKVKQLALSSIKWLLRNIRTTDPVKASNAFFSGSTQGSNLPDLYPFNYIIDRESFAIGVSGYIDEAVYGNALKKKHSPIDFHGHNTKGNEFLFWSCEPYTYAVALLALVQYFNIE